jgi:hypothetical protein
LRRKSRRFIEPPLERSYRSFRFQVTSGVDPAAALAYNGALRRAGLAGRGLEETMKKVWAILSLVGGCVLVILLLSAAAGNERPPLRGWGAAAALIIYGVSALYKLSRADRALQSGLLQDPRVVGFYQNTQAAWASGRLAPLNKQFQQEAAGSYEDFVKRYPPLEGTALHVLFTQFPLLLGEFMVGTRDSQSGRNKAWFVLTNLRLIQKDGASGLFRELRLGDIASFVKKGVWTAKLTFQMKSGEEIVFEKVEIFPAEKFLNAALQGLG